MKSINEYFKESQAESYLMAAYRECWRRMLSAISTLPREEVIHLSNPFLVKSLPSYRKAERKVLFVGQETNGWESFQISLDTFNHEDEDIKRDNIIEYLQWMYEDLRFKRNWESTPFWKGIRRIYKAISPGEGDDGFLNTQLVRFDYEKKRPPQYLEELLQQEYNVLPMEIDALLPDIIIFVTGPDYDNRLRATYNNYGKIGDNLLFEPIDGFKINELARVTHSELPYHTYRTYHPNFLRYKNKSFFESIVVALGNLVQEKV